MELVIKRLLVMPAVNVDAAMGIPVLFVAREHYEDLSFGVTANPQDEVKLAIPNSDRVHACHDNPPYVERPMTAFLNSEFMDCTFSVVGTTTARCKGG
jgi:hypothetical protein